MKREQVVAELRRHQIVQVVRESGVSNATVYKYLNGKAVSPRTEARLEDYARKVKHSSPSPFGDEVMEREQIVAELRRHPIEQVVRESGVPTSSVYKYLYGRIVRPHLKARLEDYVREVMRSSPSIVGSEATKRERIVAELRRHPIVQVIRESGVSNATVYKYLNGKAVSPYIEARLEDFAREVAK